MAQQLLKKGTNGYENVDPKTFTEAVKEKGSNKHLDEILSGFNSYFVSYNGSRKLTRLSVIDILRRRGLYLTYILYDGTLVVEYYDGTEVDDANWALDSNWRDGSNQLVGDISISAEGNWVINGVDSGIPARGEKGDAPILRVNDEHTYIEYSYNSKVWYKLMDLDLITPKIEIEDTISIDAASNPSVENIGDNFNVALQFKLPKSPDVKVGTVTTLPSGSKATVINGGTAHHVSLNFGIPMGNTGAQGQKGDTTTIKGIYDTEELLKQAFPTGDGNNAYLVGTTTPYELYLYLDSKWVSVGNINQIEAGVFDGGRADTKYGGARVIDCGGANVVI